MISSHLLAREASFGENRRAALHAKINRKLDKLETIKICEGNLNPSSPMAPHLSGIITNDVSRLLIDANKAWKKSPAGDHTHLLKVKTQAKYEADMEIEQPILFSVADAAKFRGMHLDDAHVQYGNVTLDDGDFSDHQAEASNITLADNCWSGFGETDLLNHFERFTVVGGGTSVSITPDEHTKVPSKLVPFPPRQEGPPQQELSNAALHPAEGPHQGDLSQQQEEQKMKVGSCILVELCLRSYFVPMDSSVEATICTAGNVVEMSLDERFVIMKSIGLRSIDENEVRMRLEKKVAPICYVWCDPSPSVHIAQGIMMVLNVNKMVKAGCRVKILIADWFAHVHNKFGGDLNEIRTIGYYMIEIWKAAGLELNGVEFVWLSDEINSHSDEYWTLVMDIARNNTLSRVIRCWDETFEYAVEVYGKPAEPYGRPDVMASMIFEPCMHCAGVLLLKADIWLLSMDHDEDLQEVRKLTREYCEDMKSENRPIILSHNKLPNLIEDHEFGKIGDPAWAIFMEDGEQNLSVKVSKAFCPAKVAEGNPCLEYIKYIVFPWFGHFEVPGKEENSGSRMFHKMEELITDYESGALHSAEVKRALKKALNKIMKPVRAHFTNNTKAKHLAKAMEEHYSF